MQILGVVPRTLEPIPLDERDPTTLTPAELLVLVQRQRVSSLQSSLTLCMGKAF